MHARRLLHAFQISDRAHVYKLYIIFYVLPGALIKSLVSRVFIPVGSLYKIATDLRKAECWQVNRKYCNRLIEKSN